MRDKVYRVVFSPTAMRDMDRVWDDVYEASKSFDIADAYVSEFTEKIIKKKEFPRSGIPLTYKGLFTGFYFVNYKKYNAFYRIKEDRVEVSRVLLATMDYMVVLFGKSEYVPYDN